MDRTISPGDAALLRQEPVIIKRYLTWQPRTVIGTAVVDGSPALDPDNLSLHSFHYRDATDDFEGGYYDYTVEFGTTPGARDVCVLRARKPLHPPSKTFYVGETASAEAPISDGIHVTLLKERRPWERRIRRKLIGDVDFTEYQDYDIGYGAENESFYPPIANITEDEEGHSYRPAAFFDSGETFRTVNLSAHFSFSPVNPITTFYWMLPAEADLTIGTVTSETIQFTLPQGCYEVGLLVDTGTGLAFRYVQLWSLAGDGTDDNLVTQFSVDSDVRGEGRQMVFNIWDEKSHDIPEGSLMCYFEIATFGGDPAPPQYIDQFIGWTLSDSVLFKMNRNLYQVTLGGMQSWLDKISNGAQTIYDPRTEVNPTAVSSRYIEMPNNTPDKMAHYFLRLNTTCTPLMNIYFSDYQIEIEGFTSDEGSVWSQIVDSARRYFGIAGCDSLGSLFLVRHFSYLEQSERDLISPIIGITNADWPDAQAPTFTEDKTDKIGKVDIYGSQYDVSFSPYEDYSHVYRVQAPGIVPGKGPGKETPPSVFLRPGSVALLQLRQLGGHHFARLNNKMSDVSIPLISNLDIVEPCWGIPVTLTYVEQNSRDLIYNDKQFLIKNISVSHSNARGQQPKVITWAVEQVTKGYPGVGIDVTQKPDIIEYPPGSRIPNWTGQLPTNGIVFSGDSPLATRVVAYDPDTGEFLFEDISDGLSSAGVGYCIWAYADPWNYHKMFLITDIGLMACDNIESFSGWYLVLSNSDLFGGAHIGHYCTGSAFQNGWHCVIAGENVIVVTDNNWSTMTRLTVDGAAERWSGIPFSLDIIRESGHLLASSRSPSTPSHHNLFHSSNGGFSWSGYSDIAYIPTQGNNDYVRIAVPYTRPGGSANMDDGNLVIGVPVSTIFGAEGYVSVYQGSTLLVRVGSTHFSGNYAYPDDAAHLDHPLAQWSSDPRSLTFFTHDPSYAFYMCRTKNAGVNDNALVRHTEDLFETRNQGSLFGNGTINGVNANGWPMNPDVGISWGRGDNGFLKITLDGGVVWFGNTPPTWPNAPFSKIAYAEFSLFPFI